MSERKFVTGQKKVDSEKTKRIEWEKAERQKKIDKAKIEKIESEKKKGQTSTTKP